MNETTLLPCPFCGGKAEIVTSDLYGIEKYAVGCSSCPVIIAEYGEYKFYATEAEAIAAWNTRAERTCDIECFDDGVDEGLDGEWFSYSSPMWYLSCGHTAQGTEKPNFCPNCGRKVVDA